jgi:hypothetical protein
MKINEAATSDEATFATTPDARVDDWEEEYRRGFGDGMVWASDYATEGELRDLAENFELGQGGDFDTDHSLSDFMRDKEGIDTVAVSPYWQGFIEGAGEVWSTREPPAFGHENAI